eukprot:4645292-Pleurochrysis_carterae.AAC.1
MERDMRKRQSPMARGLTPPFGFCKAISLASWSRSAHAGCRLPLLMAVMSANSDACPAKW